MHKLTEIQNAGNDSVRKGKNKLKMGIIWEMFDCIKNTNTGIIAVSRKEKTEGKVIKTYLINLHLRSSQTWVKNQIQVPEAKRAPQEWQQ